MQSVQLSEKTQDEFSLYCKANKNNWKIQAFEHLFC